MEFDKVIKKRISTRRYNSRKVKDKDIEKLIKAASLAPSAGNRQPWYFVILKEDDKNKVADMIYNKIDEKNIVNESKIYNPIKSATLSVKIIKSAPVLILVFREKNEQFIEADYLSIGCACEHICLKATDMKMASLWVRDVIYAQDEIESKFASKNMHLITGIVVGYSKKYHKIRKRKQLSEIMTFYKDR